VRSPFSVRYLRRPFVLHSSNRQLGSTILKHPLQSSSAARIGNIRPWHIPSSSINPHHLAGDRAPSHHHSSF
ncbi:hypothetical protein, partial [Herbaspirillum rhizosphaerae]|uniref:hypothetical protein n=1 Tax=Herbaspirillum rhizosphaerae TaxID=346179 RepID=UPI00196A153B